MNTADTIITKEKTVVIPSEQTASSGTKETPVKPISESINIPLSSFQTNYDLMLVSTSESASMIDNRFFPLDSFVWNKNKTIDDSSIFKNTCDTISNMGKYPTVNGIPTAYIREFKPTITKYKELASVFSTTMDFTSKLCDKIQMFASGESSDLSFLDKVTSCISTSTLQQFASETYTSATKASLTSFSDSFPEYVYYHLLAGVWGNMFELPCVNIPNFLESNDTDAWGGISNLDTSLGKSIKFIKSIVNGFLDNMNIITGLKYTTDGRNTPYPEVTFKVNLFNRTIDDVAKNLYFLHALIPGNYWFQNGFFIEPPTLYSVYMPGRIILPLCSCSMTAKTKGKNRTLKHAASTKYISKVLKEKILYDSRAAESATIPDVYELELKFNSLLPNNMQTWIMGNQWDNDNSTQKSNETNQSYSPQSFYNKPSPYASGDDTGQFSFIVDFVKKIFSNLETVTKTL